MHLIRMLLDQRTDLFLDRFEKHSSVDPIYFFILITGGSNPKLALFESIIINYCINIQKLRKRQLLDPKIGKIRALCKRKACPYQTRTSGSDTL